MRKRRITFFGHLMRIDNSRLIKYIFNLVYKTKVDNYLFQGKDGAHENIIRTEILGDSTQNFKGFE